MSTPTTWVQNANKITPSVGYASSSVTYSSSSTRYSGIDVTQDEFNELPISWTSTNKNNTQWQANTDSTANLYAYDSAAHSYDSAVDTYDGIVSGESPITTSNPTLWV